MSGVILLAALGYAALAGLVVFLLVVGLGWSWVQLGAIVLALGLLLSGCVAYETESVDLMNPSPTLAQRAEKKACLLAKKRGIACWQPEATP